MGAVGVREERRVPAEVGDLEELAEAVVVDPKDAVVERGRTLGVVVERLLQLARPVHHVQLRVVATPAHVRPRILQHYQPHSLFARPRTLIWSSVPFSTAIEEGSTILFISRVAPSKRNCLLRAFELDDGFHISICALIRVFLLLGRLKM